MTQISIKEAGKDSIKTIFSLFFRNIDIGIFDALLFLFQLKTLLFTKLKLEYKNSKHSNFYLNF